MSRIEDKLEPILDKLYDKRTDPMAIIGVKSGHYTDVLHAIDEIKALIQEEVRLGRVAELKRMRANFIIKIKRYYKDPVKKIDERIAHLNSTALDTKGGTDE